MARMSRKTMLIGAVAALALLGALAAGFVLLRPQPTDAWEFIGPNRTEIWTLAFDPTTPTTLYAGTGDGVYKSEDGGVTWRIAGSGLSPRSLVVDPATPTTLYAGEYSRLYSREGELRDEWRGVLKSEDGGATWRVMNNGLGERPEVDALALDPMNSQIVYAGTRRGIYRSDDGGANWRLIEPTGLVSTLVIDPMSPTTLYAGGSWRGVLKSEDGGATWRQISDDLDRASVRALLIDPANPRVIFAGTDAGVYQSEDGGETWRAVNDGLPEAADNGLPEGVGQDERRVTALFIDPSGVMYANVSDDIYRRAEREWRKVEVAVPAPRADVEGMFRLLAVDPRTPATLYVAVSYRDGISYLDGGLFRSADGGVTWQPIELAQAPSIP
ncbi:MAG: hypothetical protein RMJ55_12020 [Roseiflexaceae bacterium]|nr:hypothetical protein [Roseiflexaceae bacterium]